MAVVVAGFTDTENQRVLQSLDAFDVCERIREDGFFVVNKGAIKATAQPVALKRINQRKADHMESGYNSLIREFKFLCSVSHPALQYAVGLYHPDDWKETILVTPFHQNGSLKELCEDLPDRLNNTMKTRIIFGVCSAMICLHEAGIVHGDLKPDSVLIDDKLCPILSGFGLSQRFGEASPMSHELGTYYYRAPEVIDAV